MATESDEGSLSSALPHSTLLTFLIADLRGYTSYTSEHGDEAAALLTSRFAELCEEIVVALGGEILELRGDEVVAIFASARQALRSAVELRRRFPVDIGQGTGVDVGIGVDAGDAVPVKGGYRSGALNLAARLQSLARRQVFASETVVALAGTTEGLTFFDQGRVRVKGLAAPVQVFEVAPEGESSSTLTALQPLLTNLPDDSAPFIGRQREIEQITELLADPHTRLVTLTGPGGTGKTRLALQVGNALLPGYRDGVFFVNLAPLADPQLVPAAIAEALGVKEESNGSLPEMLYRHFSAKDLLLVLDNFEHLLDAAPLVASLLDSCRELHALVTSRIPLHLSREHEYAVRPLEVPDIDQLPALGRLAANESVAFFVDRARAADPNFALSEQNAAVIAEICTRLDGLPLAIELAAARIKLFPPQALLQRLSSKLKLLTGGARDRPTRQQTLRNTIDWSYSLLSEDERTLFARLSVFAGGCSLEAVEQVCDPEGHLDVLAALTGLVEKNLLTQRGMESVRCQMLETLREYSAERLSESGEAEELERRHAAYYLALRERVGPNGAESTLTNRIESEHDNVRRAMGWLFRHEREGSLPSEERPTVGARFDAVYLSIAHSPTLERIQQKAYGDEYPTEVKPFGLTTWSDLRRMVSELAVGPGQRFVDLGCGEGGAGLWLARETGASVIGIDISSVAITRARARIEGFGLVDRAQYEVGDITSTLLSPLSCDGAICIDVLWMIPDTVAALSEAARILRAGARLILTTWEFPPRALEDADATDYRAALAAAGFDVEAYDPIEAWEGQFRALLASYEAARNDLAREFGEEMAENFIEFERQRAALLPEWKRVFIKARRV